MTNPKYSVGDLVAYFNPLELEHTIPQTEIIDIRYSDEFPGLSESLMGDIGRPADGWWYKITALGGVWAPEHCLRPIKPDEYDEDEEIEKTPDELVAGM